MSRGTVSLWRLSLLRETRRSTRAPFPSFSETTGSDGLGTEALRCGHRTDPNDRCIVRHLADLDAGGLITGVTEKPHLEPQTMRMTLVGDAVISIDE